MLVQPAGDALAEETDAVIDVWWAVVAFLLVYLVGRYLVEWIVMRAIRARNERNPTLVDALASYLRVGVVLVGLAVALTVAGYGYVLTRSAIVVAAVTLAIGVAGQEVVGDLVSGVFLVVDPEFNVEDWIVWEGGEGVVETVGLRSTRVRTPNNEVVTVPNTALATNPVTRPYGRDQFRIDVRFGVAFDDDVDAAVALLRETTDEFDAILADPPPTVRVEELGDDAVWLRTQFWVGSPSRRDVDDVRSAFLRETVRRFEDAGITIDPPAGREVSGRLDVERDGE